MGEENKSRAPRAVTGRCLCGTISYHASVKPHDVAACHCSMSRRWLGGILLAVSAEGEVEFSAPGAISTYRSSEGAERRFCSHCGSNLFYRLVESGDYILCTGAFDDQVQFALSEQIFIDEKPHWYEFANRTLVRTGAEMIAAFEKSSGE